MKKFYLFLTFLVISISFLTAEEMNHNFTLVLNKQGSNKVWFSPDGPDEDEKYTLYDRHIFPLVSESDTPLFSDAGTKPQFIESNIYLNWIVSAGSVEISVVFSSDESSYETGYMLESYENGVKTGSQKRNFKVQFIDSKNNLKIDDIEIAQYNGEEKEGDEVLYYHSKDPKTQADRTRSFTVGASSNNTSGAIQIKMTVLPLYRVFMDAQYVGYVIASLKTNS